MFSVEQKKHIADVVEKTLLELRHPEMPTEKPIFRLHVDGKESWSFADIEPNHTFNDGNKQKVNPFNEIMAKQGGNKFCSRNPSQEFKDMVDDEFGV